MAVASRQVRHQALCQGCPLYGDGLAPFYPDRLQDNAPIYLLGQTPEQDTRAFEQGFLKGAGLSIQDMSVAHAYRCAPSGDLPPITTTQAREALKHCERAYGRIPNGTRLIVTQGDYASVVATGGTVTDGDDSTGWRGYLRPYERRDDPKGVSEYWVPAGGDLPVLVSIHLPKLHKEPWLTIATKRDWAKVPAILKGKWPQRPPSFLDRAPDTWPEMFAFDTEWDRETKELLRYSMSWGVGDNETSVVERADHDTPRSIGVDHKTPRVVTQYAPADVEHLDCLSRRHDDSTQPSVWQRFLIEDTVWKHSVLWSDHRHDLNYLGSVYGPFNRWKHLSESDPRLYAGMDAVGLLHIDRALERELNADPASRIVWETIDRPAIQVFVEAQYRGLKTNPARVLAVKAQLVAQMHEAGLKAQAIAGWPINVGSDRQVGHRLYEVEGLHSKR